jgi:glycosyltransferase involved in cell wall biosynthesis
MLSGDRPRLCIVDPNEHEGGAEYQISLLIDALAAGDRYDIHYLARFVDKRERSRNYRVSKVGSDGPIPRLGYLIDGPSLYRTLREIDPSLIYQRVAGGYTGICAYYSRRRSIPMLWHVAHDTDVMPQHLDRSRNFVRLRLEKSAVEYGLRRATRIVVQTRHQAELLKENYGRTADAVIHNFHPPATELIDKSGPLTVVWIANLKPWKRPEVFVRLARSFIGRADTRFIMVGAPAAASDWYSSLTRSIDDTANLQYVKQKTLDEVNQLLAQAHIFVNTSTHEGFPNTFVQSWLRGAVVVSLDVDPDQVLQTHRVGIAAHSESELTAAVRALIEDPELRSAYASRGREHAIAQHSLRNAQELVHLIDSWRARSA